MSYVHAGDGAPLRGSIVGDVTSVAVVGAGVAGLTVANALTGLGIPTVVLEARDRVGGRTHTVDFGATQVDLGASWVHEPTQNPLSDVLRALDIGQARFEPLDDAWGWDSDLDALIEPAGLSVLFDVMGSAVESTLKGPDAPLPSAIDEALADMGLAEPLRSRARSLARTYAEADSSGPLEDLTTAGFPANTMEFEGSPMGDVPVGGYRELVKALAGGLDIRLGLAVETVTVDADGVRVVSTDGSELEASHVVVTVPLGVLKSGVIAFEPRLDTERVRAIDQLGFGRFDKLVLRYEQAYWREAGVPHLFPTPSESAAPVKAVLSLDDLTGEPVIMVFAFGSSHPWLCSRSLEEATREVHALLCRALGKEFPPPVESLRSEWWNDPWTRGAYTYLKDGATYDDLETLGTPHAGRVLFAGEATGAARTGYVDGAILTAVREVKRLTGRDSVTIQRLASDSG